MSCHKITVVGTGYVGMSMAALLGQRNEVIALDIDEARVDLINQGESTVADSEFEQYLAGKELSLTATLDSQAAERAQEGNLVVFGIRPTGPETGYGYLEVAAAGDGPQPLKSFVEKPDRATAEQYLAEGRYF